MMMEQLPSVKAVIQNVSLVLMETHARRVLITEIPNNYVLAVQVTLKINKRIA